MTSSFGEKDLDGEVVFNRYLGAGDDLDVLQELLAERAPKWASKLRIWKGPKDQRPIDPGRPGALREGVLTAAGERGVTYRTLVDQHGAPPFERLVGSVELRGANPDLFVVVSVDEMVLSPLGTKRQLGNRIALQIRRPNVNGSSGDSWLRLTFEALCARLSPAWGWAGHAGEYWAKVMSDPPRIEAIGRDFGRFLPGVFWLNFFGRPYRELVGADRFQAARAEVVTLVDDGVLIALGGNPADWDAPEYAASEQKVRNHLGSELFFSKAEPERLTVVPNWDC